MDFSSSSKVSFPGCLAEAPMNSADDIPVAWANNPGFIFGKTKDPGFDPIVGQAPNSGPRTTSGLDPKNQDADLTLPTNWVVSKGGEYFFSPSVPALEQTFALAA